MILSNAGRCPISAQCRILGVAKSTCHWMLEHPEAERAAAIIDRIVHHGRLIEFTGPSRRVSQALMFGKTDNQ